jgi:hypothetical protein
MSDPMDAEHKRDRPGWPLDDVIPAGEVWWRIFCELATDEQVEQALAAIERMVAERKKRVL